MNRRNFIQRASAVLATMGLPGFRTKPPADVFPYEFTASVTKAIREQDVKLIVECSNEVWNDDPLVQLIGSTKDVEKWSVSYMDPRTNMLVIRAGEYVDSPPV